MSEHIFQNIRIDENGIAEISGSQAFGVKASDIKKVVLKETYGLKNRITALVAGSIMSVIGLAGFLPFVKWIKNGGALMMDESFSLLIFLILGIWLIYNALTRFVVLNIYTAKDPRKLIFTKRTDSEKALDFVEKACKKHNYPFEKL